MGLALGSEYQTRRPVMQHAGMLQWLPFVIVLLLVKLLLQALAK